jgi:hypothetical protein
MMWRSYSSSMRPLASYGTMLETKMPLMVEWDVDIGAEIGGSRDFGKAA